MSGRHAWTPAGEAAQTHLKTSDCFPDKLWYCRLSPNHKMLHYGDVEDDVDNPPIETLQEKSELKAGQNKNKNKSPPAGAAVCSFQTLSPSVPVADIKVLLTGKDCPHMKENKGKQNKVGTSSLLGSRLRSPPVG